MTAAASRPVAETALSLRTCADQQHPVHCARSLTQGGCQARIVLDGQVYCLRITRAGKLILTK